MTTDVAPPPKTDDPEYDRWITRLWKRVKESTGVTAHTALTALGWTSSGHTGTATRIAAFDGAGAAAEYTLSGTGTQLPTTASPTFSGTLNCAALTPTGLVDISGASAGQVKFPATQNASANANTLDDYEEGSSSPTVTSASGTLTTASATLTYTKVGRLVTFRATVTITTNGTGAGNIQFTLPFTAATRTALMGHDTTNGLAMTGHVTGSTASFVAYNAAYPGADGHVMEILSSFEV